MAVKQHPHIFAMSMQLTTLGGMAIHYADEWSKNKDRDALDRLIYCLVTMQSNEYSTTIFEETEDQFIEDVESFAAQYKQDVCDLIKLIMFDELQDAINKVHKIWWES